MMLSLTTVRDKVKHNKLDTVLILAETKEYETYAGGDLEEFYRSCGLRIIHRPIADYNIPNQPVSLE